MSVLEGPTKLGTPAPPDHANKEMSEEVVAGGVVAPAAAATVRPQSAAVRPQSQTAPAPPPAPPPAEAEMCGSIELELFECDEVREGKRTRKPDHANKEMSVEAVAREAAAPPGVIMNAGGCGSIKVVEKKEVKGPSSYGSLIALHDELVVCEKGRWRHCRVVGVGSETKKGKGSMKKKGKGSMKKKGKGSSQDHPAILVCFPDDDHPQGGAKFSEIVLTELKLGTLAKRLLHAYERGPACSKRKNASSFVEDGEGSLCSAVRIGDHFQACNLPEVGTGCDDRTEDKCMWHPSSAASPEEENFLLDPLLQGPSSTGVRRLEVPTELAAQCASHFESDWKNGMLPLGNSTCRGYGSYSKTLATFSAKEQTDNTLLITNNLLAQARTSIPGFAGMESVLVAWISQNYYGVKVALHYAHGLRQGPDTLASTGFDVHQDTEDFDFITHTVVVKLTADRAEEPSSQMRVVGAGQPFSYGNAAGSAGAFLARLHHSSVPASDSRGQCLKLAYFFRIAS